MQHTHTFAAALPADAVKSRIQTHLASSNKSAMSSLAVAAGDT